MDAKEFFKNVENMRNAQKKYFSCRTQANLKEAKKLEKIVDDEIKRVNNLINNTPGLFD